MKIDFVVAWVDGSDKSWQKKKAQYAGIDVDEGQIDASAARYRDWGIFEYWFRSVEENAPWVNRVYLVTDHQVPDFLRANHPKLHIVFHDQYIPERYLPTFSSHTIELNFHRIHGLSEYFVYFNDDMFLNKPVCQEDFFRDGKPCYELIERPLEPCAPLGLVNYVAINNMGVVNNHFARNYSLKYMSKFLNYRYGKSGIKNFLMLFWRKYQHFQDNHMPCPYLKSTFEDVWEKSYSVCDATCLHRFRMHSDLNQFVFRYWDIARGNFSPYSFKGGYYSVNSANVDRCVKDIIEAEHMMICLNDSGVHEGFDTIAEKIRKAFAKRYPGKSTYEM